MSTRFLLDTNICIYIAKANPPAVLARFRKARAGSIAISAVTYGELLERIMALGLQWQPERTA